jgi:PAS domain S-box-containing protein
MHPPFDAETEKFITAEVERRLAQLLRPTDDSAQGPMEGRCGKTRPALTEIRTFKEELLLTNEELQPMLDNLIALAGVLTPDGVLIKANHAALAMAGLTADDVVGKPFPDAYWWSWSPEVQKQLWEAIRQAAAGQSCRFDVMVRMAEARMITIDFMLAPLLDEQGRVKYLIPSAFDISDRLQAQEALSKRNEILLLVADTARMLLSSETPERITQRICERVMVFLGGDAFFNYLIEAGSQRMHLNAWAGIPEARAREIEWLESGKAVCGCVARDGCRIIAEDIGTSSDERTSLVRSLGIQAYVCHPLVYQGRTLGTLSFGTRARPRFTSDEIDLMRTIADLVATAMARKQAEDAVSASRAKLEAALNSMTDAVFITDSNGRIIEFNDAFITYHRFKNREECTRTLARQPDILDEFMTGDKPAAVGQRPVALALGGEKATSAAYTLQRQDTGESWVGSYSFGPIRNHTGEVIGAVISGRDITGQKRAAEEMARQRELLQTIIDNIPIYLVIWDSRVQQFQFSEAFRRDMGWTEADAAPGDFMAKAYPDPEYRHEVEEYMRSLSRGFRDLKTTAKDGRLVDISWANVHLSGERSIGIGVNITERKQVEEERERLIEDLARSNKELEQFAYIASHDLQTPLRTITSFLGLLARRYQGKLSPEADEFITFAVQGAERMHQLISDILAFSRIGIRGKPFEQLDSHATLQLALENLKSEIERSGAIITIEELPEVIGDRLQLAQLFQNLVDNALKYRKKDEPPSIHIAAVEKETEWEFRVRDNGIGIDPRYAERIFQIFQRLHNIDEYPGTGIGLAICRKITARHGGRIWMASEQGRGATFCFTLPKNKEP